MINSKRLLENFMEYVRIDSETKNEKAISKKIKNDLRALEFNVYEDEAGIKLESNGNNIYCFIPGTTNDEPILFSAHMDTVTPGNGIEPYIDGDYIKSRGNTILGGDDKAGIVAIMEALRVIKENNIPHRPVEVVFTICEEGGVNGAKQVEFDKLQSKKGIVLDSGGSPSQIIIEAPGQTKIYAKISGKTSHAGACPEAGISSIMVGADAISNMKLLRVDYETTANIGTFKAVGPTNIVSPSAEFIAEARSRSNDKLRNQTNHMIECLENSAKKFGATIEYNIEETYFSYAHDPEDEFILTVANTCKNIGLEVEFIPSGGGSDANIYNKNGIKTVNIGCGMELAHTTDERLSIKDFENAAKIVLDLITK